MRSLPGEPSSGGSWSNMGRRGSGRWGELGPRIVSAVVLMVLALGVTWLGGRAFDLFWLVAGWAIVWEWQTLIGGGRRPTRMLVGGLTLAVAALLTFDRLPLAAIAALLGGAAMLAAAADPGKRALSGFGIVYAGALVVAVAPCFDNPSPMPPRPSSGSMRSSGGPIAWPISPAG